MTVSAGDKFRVIPADVQAAAGNCHSTADELRAQLDTLRAYVESLGAQWIGIAAGAFTALMTDYQTFATMLENALNDIGSGLTGNEVNYSDAETANRNSLANVHGEIPGGNFA